MIKFTSHNITTYIKKSCLYGFGINPTKEGFLLRLFGTEETTWDLGEFQDKGTCELIIKKVNAGLIFGIVDIDDIIYHTINKEDSIIYFNQEG